MVIIDKRFTNQERIIINSVLDSMCKNGDGDQLLQSIEIKKSLQLTRATGNCRVNVARQSAVIKINGKLDFTEDYFKQVVAHEFIHAFRGAIFDGHGGNWSKFAKKYSRILGVEITEYVESKYILNQIREDRQAKARRKNYNKNLWNLIYNTTLINARKMLNGKYTEPQIIRMAEQAAEDLYKKYA